MKDTSLNPEISDYLEEQKAENRRYLYKFEVSHLEYLGAQKSVVDLDKNCVDWEPRAREKKCIDCKLKVIFPFQPGATLGHIGDGHL